ncbi:MAG: co-chaperone GroES [Candidatus Sumerlaeia bacterium]|nr:co-chaperone GroES [Candidatus Sumerlaeia bacterium]
MATKVTPLGDRLLVDRLESAEQKSSGGIIIPDTAKERPTEGLVIAAGEGKRLESGKLSPLAVKAGDKILFGKWSGTEVKIDGKEYIIMREDDVLAVLLPD